MIFIKILVSGPSDINASHRKLTRIHHVVGELTKYRGCFPFRKVYLQLFFHQFGCVSHRFTRRHVDVFILAAVTGATCMNTNAQEMDY